MLNNKNIKSKFGVVIQGPLLSEGITGKGSNLPKHLNTDVIKFDCIENIKKIRNVCHDLNIPFVCVFWKDENHIKKDYLKNLLKDCYIEIDPPKESHSRRNSSLSVKFRNTNRYRQIISTLSGTKFLKKMGIQYVIKIRTDMFVNIKAIIDDYNYLIEKRKKPTLMVPAIVKSKPDASMDFYFVCKSDIFINKLNKYLNSNELFINIHYDFFYKLNSISVLFKIYIKIFRGSKAMEKFIINSWNSNYAPSSLKTIKSIVWRGVNYEVPSGSLFLDNLKDSFLRREDVILSNTTQRLINLFIIDTYTKIRKMINYK